jgi:hypothetical protein
MAPSPSLGNNLMAWENGKIENSEKSKKSKKSTNLKNSEIETKTRINSRSKGQRGERELAKLFIETMLAVEATLPEHYPFKHKLASATVQRNTLQSDKGGFDLVGIPLLAPECKFAETFTLDAWWQQTLRQCKPGLFPCLFYRRARQPWRVRSYTSLQNPGISETMQWIVADYSIDGFMAWYAVLYNEWLLAHIDPLAKMKVSAV